MSRFYIALVAAVVISSTPVCAQIDWSRPTENLKVLPDTISGDDLRATMRGFSLALGVRCHFCHDDAGGRRLSEMDFASDAKPEKERARTMLKMLAVINGDWISSLDHSVERPLTRVTCLTCHRGVSRPETLNSVLRREIDSDGIEAAVAKYHELREKYYGSMAYDFSESSLNVMGYDLMGEGRVDDALAVFRLNAEMYPESGNAFDSIGDAYFQKGDLELALVFFQKAMSLNPESERTVTKLKKVRDALSQ